MAQNPVDRINFTSGIVDELKKVSWPTRHQTVRLTLVVIIVSLVVAVYIGTIDVMFTRLLQLLTK